MESEGGLRGSKGVRGGFIRSPYIQTFSKTHPTHTHTHIHTHTAIIYTDKLTLFTPYRPFLIFGIFDLLLLHLRIVLGNAVIQLICSIALRSTRFSDVHSDIVLRPRLCGSQYLEVIADLDLPILEVVVGVPVTINLRRLRHQQLHITGSDVVF